MKTALAILLLSSSLWGSTATAVFSGGAGPSFVVNSLLAFNAPGTPAVVQAVTKTTTAGGQSPPVTIVFPSNITSGSTILVFIEAHAVTIPDTYTLTDSLSNSYTVMQTQNDGTGGFNHQQTALIASNSSAGANTISVSYTRLGSPVVSELTMIAVEISGLATSSTLQTSTQSLNPTFPDTLNLTVTSPVFMVAYCMSSSFTANVTTISGYSLQSSVLNATDGGTVLVFTASGPSGIVAAPVGIF